MSKENEKTVLVIDTDNSGEKVYLKMTREEADKYGKERGGEWVTKKLTIHERNINLALKDMLEACL